MEADHNIFIGVSNRVADPNTFKVLIQSLPHFTDREMQSHFTQEVNGRMSLEEPPTAGFLDQLEIPASFLSPLKPHHLLDDSQQSLHQLHPFLPASSWRRGEDVLRPESLSSSRNPGPGSSNSHFLISFSVCASLVK